MDEMKDDWKVIPMSYFSCFLFKKIKLGLLIYYNLKRNIVDYKETTFIEI